MFEDEWEVAAFLGEAGPSAHLDFFEEVCARTLCFEERKTKADSVKPKVLRTEDLEKRNFERVHAIYQQT
jgi:hypothetical protein